jgi:chromosome segregation protein
LEKYSAEETKRIEAKVKRVETERENCTILDKKITEGKSRLEIKSKEYEDTLATVCEKWIKEKTRLEGEMKAIDDEIEELQRQIMQKRYDRQELEKSRKETVEEINSIRANYKDREDDIGELNKQIAANEQDSAETKQSIENSEETIKRIEKSLKETVDTKTELLSVIDKVKEELFDAQHKLLEKIEFREKVGKEKQEYENELQAERTQITNLEQIKSRTQNNLAKAESRLKEILAKIMSDKIVLSQMEDEKKALAAARKFKEASKVSTDIKNLQKNIEIAESEVESIKASKTQYENKLNECDKELSELKVKQENMEEQLNKSIYYELKKKMEEIKEMEVWANEYTGELLEVQVNLIRDELKEMTGRLKYLEECEFETMDSNKINETIKQLTEQSKVLEAEINELSLKEEYDEADLKQQVLDTIKEKLEMIKRLSC